MTDIATLKHQNNIVDVIGRYVRLQKRGSEHYGVCPFHSDEKESLQVNEQKQIFKCFPCGASGDSIDFLTKYGRTFQEAIKELEDPYNTAGTQATPEQRQAFKPKPRVEWKNAVPTGLPGEIRHWQNGVPNAVWPYKNADGIVIGYACRFNRPDGQKDVLPFTYKTDGKREEWRWHGFDKPRPLYNLDKIHAKPAKTILLVEGEKTADAANRLIETAVATTWMGGADGIRSVDITPLHGRKIILWADNDYTHAYGEKHPNAGQLKPFHEQPGNKAMLALYELLKPHCPVIKWVRNSQEFPCGWDIADATDWTPEQAREFVKANLIDVPKVEPEPEQIPPPELMNDLPPIHDIPDLPPLEEGPTHKDSPYFKFLGYEKTDTGSHAYYFFAYEPKTVVRLSPSAMSKANLLQMAPLRWWEDSFPGRKDGMSLEMAQQWLISRCHDVGIFNEKWIRGRGAWIDKDNVVIHAGSHLIVNGTPHHFHDFKSKYIYEIGEEMGFDTENPIGNADAYKLIDVLNCVNWERDINSYLLAGWCVVAPVCGALNWRPHLWLTGAAGTGKSWLFEHLVRRLLGESALAVQGETSEAGLRQLLKHDALPVVFDEAEGAELKAQNRIQDILALVRSASASDGGIMAKGTAAGTAKTYRIRSCFAFASIAVQLTQQSDRTRVTVLGIRNYSEDPREQTVKKERWQQLQRLYNDVITDEFCARLRARTISLLPTLLKNAKTFSNAAASVLGEQRTGDQIGALLAGAYSLSSSKEITFDDAVKWIQQKDWSEEKAQEQTRDELLLIAHIMESITRVESGAGTVERTIGELAMIAAKWKYDSVITEDQAHDRLHRLGIKLEDNHVFVSNSADSIKKMLRDTPWAKNHNKILLRIESAQAVESTRFSTGIRTRAVRISIDKIFR